jgi:hypothetical protein
MIKPFKSFFKKKEKEEKPYMVMGDNNLPLWVIPLPSGINMDTEDEPNKKGK